MKSIGVPELLVILFFLCGLIAFIGWVVKRKDSAVGSRACGHCGQRIPDIGVFCPICGQK
jgi:hypothetical protein